MKEITEDVLKGDYPHPLGRGLLDWRVTPLSPNETKHIVAADFWYVYLKRNNVDNIGTVISVDRRGPTPSLKGIAEVLGCSAVYINHPTTEDETLEALGFELSGVRYILPTGGDVQPPVNMTEDCVLTDEERDGFLAAAKDNPALNEAMKEYSMGVSKFHRVDYGGDRSALLLAGNMTYGLDLVSYFALDIEGEMFCADMFAYLSSKDPEGGLYCIGVSRFKEPTPLIITLETHGAKAAGVFSICQGESNAS